MILIEIDLIHSKEERKNSNKYYLLELTFHKNRNIPLFYP